MKKIVAVVGFLAIGGVAVAGYAYIRSPERSACLHMAELCGEKGGTKDDLDRCVDDVKQLRKIGGDEAVDKGIQCVNDSKTCGEAVGCVAGAGMKGAQGVVNEFFKGFGKATQ
jgi:hypothetical protein